jgi:hypothetical protein
MSRVKILFVYVAIDLVIVGGVVWCVFHRVPVGKYLIPAATLFVLNGVWMVVVTLRNTPPRQ